MGIHLRWTKGDGLHSCGHTYQVQAVSDFEELSYRQSYRAERT